MAKFPSYSLLSPRKSFSRGDYSEQKSPDLCKGKPQQQLKKTQPSVVDKSEEADQEDGTRELGDFEFNLVDNFTMLAADELFYDGKLLPLQVSTVKMAEASSEPPSSGSGVTSQQTTKPLSRNEISIMDPYLFSPKAPRCPSNWKELLGLRKVYQKEKENNHKSNSCAATKSVKNLLNRSSKASMSLSFDGSVNLPLLTDYSSRSSSRVSLSSSSPSHEHDDLPRLSLDAYNKSTSVTLPRLPLTNKKIALRVANTRKSTSSSDIPESRVGVTQSTTRRQPDRNLAGLVFMDSPRMNASGKIVYNTLERSSSSPSSYGGPRYKHSSVQRSYSANVRVTPVLNVPVCSLRGSSSSKTGGVFGLFASSSTQQKRDSFGSKHRKNRN